MGLIVAFVAGLLSTLLEPVKRAVERLGRRWFEGSPFDIYVETDLGVIWAGQKDWFGATFFYPGSPPTDRPPGTLGEWQRWIADRGGFDYRSTTVKVILVGRSPTTVVVGAPEVNDNVKAAPEGTLLSRPVGGASMTPVGFQVNLDAGGSWVAVTDEHGSPAQSLSWSLKKDEAQSFMIHGVAEVPGLWEWTLKFPVYVDGRRRKVKIDDDGKPFRTVGGSYEALDLRWYDGKWQ